MAVGYNPKIVTDGLVSVIDFANPKSFSVNTFPNPLDIYGWYVPKRGNNTGNACTVAQDFDTPKSPAGGIPMRMDVTGNDPHTSSFNTATWNISTVLNSQTWRVSVYAKASQVLNNCEIYIFGANSSGISFVSGSYIGITNKTITVTTEWQRFDHFITFNNASVAFIQLRLDGPNSGGSGTTVWWDGLQVEPYALTNFNPFYNQNYSTVTNLIGSQQNNMSVYPQYNNSGFLIFDGIDDTIVTANTPLVKDFTLDFWMRSTGSSTGSGRSVLEYGGSTYGIIAVYNMTQSSCLFYFATVGGTSSPTLNKNLANNAWHNVVMTYNGISGKVYVDGLLEINVNTGLSGNLRTTSTTNFSIGRWRGTNTYQDVNIGSLKVYDRDLSQQEIEQNFDAIRGRFGI